MKRRIRERIESALAVKQPRTTGVAAADGVNWDPRIDWGEYRQAIRGLLVGEELVFTYPEGISRGYFRSRVVTIGRRLWRGKDGWRFVTRTPLGEGKLLCRVFRMAVGK